MGLGGLREKDLSSDQRGISYDGSTGGSSDRSKRVMRSETGGLCQDPGVRTLSALEFAPVLCVTHCFLRFLSREAM